MCVQHSAGLRSNTIPLPVSCVRHDNHAKGFVSTAADTEAPAAAWSIVCCADVAMNPHTNHLSITTTAYQTLLLRTMRFRHLPSAVAPAPTSFKTARCYRLPKRLCSCCWALHQSATAERCHSHNIWDCSLLPALCCLLLLASKTHQSVMPSSDCCAAGMLPLPLLLTQCASQSITAPTLYWLLLLLAIPPVSNCQVPAAPWLPRRQESQTPRESPVNQSLMSSSDCCSAGLLPLRFPAVPFAELLPPPVSLGEGLSHCGRRCCCCCCRGLANTQQHTARSVLCWML